MQFQVYTAGFLKSEIQVEVAKIIKVLKSVPEELSSILQSKEFVG